MESGEMNLSYTDPIQKDRKIDTITESPVSPLQNTHSSTAGVFRSNTFGEKGDYFLISPTTKSTATAPTTAVMSEPKIPPPRMAGYT